MCSVSYLTSVDMVAQVLTQWSIFLFLDVPIEKPMIIIIISLTEWPDTILPTAHTTNN